jgi:hypothetical protein
MYECCRINLKLEADLLESNDCRDFLAGDQGDQMSSGKIAQWPAQNFAQNVAQLIFCQTCRKSSQKILVDRTCTCVIETAQRKKSPKVAKIAPIWSPWLGYQRPLISGTMSLMKFSLKKPLNLQSRDGSR